MVVLTAICLGNGTRQIIGFCLFLNHQIKRQHLHCARCVVPDLALNYLDSFSQSLIEYEFSGLLRKRLFR